MSPKTPDTVTIPGPLTDTERRLSDALLVVAGFVCLGLAWELYETRGASRFLTMVSIGLALTGAVFLIGRVAVRAALEALEKHVGRDLTGDGVVGKPERPLIVNRKPLEWKSQGELWAAFVRQAVAHPDERSLMQMGFTDAQITAGRDALIEHGLAFWKSTDRRHGWEINEGMDADDVLLSLPYCDLGGETGA